ncbi:hypothetical protein [Alkalihalobacillus sp. TS-13]|uniref:hypothetical protein n=1 Tax=Alkalihalobacillus sp. TS-13 TaxID=2842455 RepID=UPI001C869A04|nr:hypothetical protein [Alkalihalobacillus sp. TS-13]
MHIPGQQQSSSGGIFYSDGIRLKYTARRDGMTTKLPRLMPHASGLSKKEEKSGD